MRGNRLVVNDREWRTEIVQHWPQGGPGDQPSALDVLFHDPVDPHQWVGNPLIPYDGVDLSEEGLRRLFYEAEERSWRGPKGTYWRVRIFRPGTLGADGNGDRLPDGIVSFHQAEGTGSDPVSHVVAELPPIGLLADDELERLHARAAGREAGTTRASA